MSSPLALRNISLQISDAQQESLNRTESAFVAQFSASKGLDKTLENLFLTSNSLRQKCEKTQSALKESVPRALGALEKLDIKPRSP